jgi:hypothetical protein
VLIKKIKKNKKTHTTFTLNLTHFKAHNEIDTGDLGGLTAAKFVRAVLAVRHTVASLSHRNAVVPSLALPFSGLAITNCNTEETCIR